MKGRPEKGSEVYGNLIRKRKYVILLLPVVLFILIIVAVMTGPYDLSAGEVLNIIMARFFPSAFPVDGIPYVVVWELRMPPIAIGILIGMALAVAGTILQSTLNNQLAAPSTLGITQGAGFGAALMIALSFGAWHTFNARYLITSGNAMYAVAASSFVFAILTALLIMFIGRIKGTGTGTILLAGIAVSFLFSALISLIQYQVNPDGLQAMTFWLMGSLLLVTWQAVFIVFIVVMMVLPFVFLNAPKLTALRMGEERAEALGVDVRRLRLSMIFLASLLTAVAVCFTGTIAFIGLVAPNIARLIVGDDHRFLLPAACLIGPIVLIGAHVLSLTLIAPYVLPIGIVTSLFGVPFFFALILLSRRNML